MGKKFNQYSKFGIKFLESYNGFLAWSYSKHKYVNNLAVLQDGSYVQIVDGVATPVDDVIHQFNETGYEDVNGNNIYDMDLIEVDGVYEDNFKKRYEEVNDSMGVGAPFTLTSPDGSTFKVAFVNTSCLGNYDDGFANVKVVCHYKQFLSLGKQGVYCKREDFPESAGIGALLMLTELNDSAHK